MSDEAKTTPEIAKGAAVGSTDGLGGAFKNFSTQFRECKAAGLTLPGKWKTETAVRYYSAIDGRCHLGPKEFTSQEINCGRFGGVCSSGNPGCKKLRNYQPPNDAAERPGAHEP